MGGYLLCGNVRASPRRLSDCRPWMLLEKSCCLSAICQQPSVSLWLWPSARTWCGQTARRRQVRHVYNRDQRADWLIMKNVRSRCACTTGTLIVFSFPCVCKMCTFSYRFCHSRVLQDPFVKVYLLQDGKKISKKKTSTKRDDTNPIFNEAMIFSVPSNVLQVRTFCT